MVRLVPMSKSDDKTDSKKKTSDKKSDRKTSRKEYLEVIEREPLLKQETWHTVYGLLALVLCAVFMLASFHRAGPAGDGMYSFFTSLFGWGYFLLPILGLILGTTFLKSVRPNIALTHTIGSGLFLLSGLGLLDAATTATHRGGIVGVGFAWPFITYFGIYAGTLVMGALLAISLLVLFDTRPNLSGLFTFVANQFRKHSQKDTAEMSVTDTTEDAEEYTEDAQVDEPAPTPPPVAPEPTPEPIKDNEEESLVKPIRLKTHQAYIAPPLSLLEKDRGKPNTGDIKANGNIIKRTLQNFGIEVEMDEITIGPTVTRYALKPAQGVKLSRIVGLQNDLALSLAAHPLRIEAPIPGKSLVGIEIPNKAKSIIGFASLLADDKFQNAHKPLTVALGKNIAGKPIFANLAKMPHALIAGATGSGKSVTAHAIITSLLYRNGPEDLRLIMVDPKRVELTLYNKIPHLLTPVITDAKKAILALKWAAKEMDRRYDILEKQSVRDIESYHTNVVAKFYEKNKPDAVDAPERMPYIVIMIDELADIMQAYPRELESAIVRLAQMSRAVGIHLILSTQRPSVNVITGLIKANIPTRIALQVASQIDSRTILDQPGAEKLLGAGDMLYSSGEMSSPERVQCAYVSEEEVKKVVKFIAENNVDESPDNIAFTSNNISADKSIFEASIDGGEDVDDDMYEEARQTVIDTGKASTSFLQRKLGIGYARAARLIDILEERGIVGPGNGAKPREVLQKSVDTERENFG